MLHDPPSPGSVRASTMIDQNGKENKMGRKDGEEKVGAGGKTWHKHVSMVSTLYPVMYDPFIM